MNSTEQILVIILASALAAFLIIGIVALIKFIQILNHINKITEKAEHLAEQAEAVGSFFQKTAGPIAIGKLLGNIAEHIFGGRESKRSKRSKNA
ncbi:MAG: hypothetical protein AAB459_01355 [Patescibacteria group bacterium]